MGEYLKELHGTAVINTNHAVQRMRQRQNAMTNKQVEDFFERVLRHYKSNKGAFLDAPYNSEYFFYSGCHQRGMILAFRRDFKGNMKGYHFILVTIYPYGKAYPVQRDTPIVYI